MRETLYEALISAEDINERLNAKADDFNSYLRKLCSLPGFHEIHLRVPEIDVREVQRGIIKKFEKNLVLCEAMTGRQSIEDSLSELAKVRRPVRRLFPIAKNKAHNERLEQIGELIGYPRQLRTNGILAPDNFFSGVAMTTAMAFGAGYLISKIAFVQPIDAELMSLFRNELPIAMSLVMAPLGGMAFHITGENLPIGAARYVDSKVQEFYR